MGKTNKHLKSRHFQVKNNPYKAQHKQKIGLGIVKHTPVLDGFKDPVVLGFCLIFIVLVGINLVSASAWTADLNNGLIAYWNLTGGMDNTGNGHDLYVGGTTSQTGLLGNSREFVVADKMQTNATDFNFGAKNFTINLWIYASDSAYRSVLGTYTTDGWMLYNNNPSGYYAFYNNGDLATDQISNINKWQMLTVRRNDTAESIWINGTEVTSGADSDVDVGGVNLTFGAVVVAGFAGKIDETGIWNRSLSLDEITQLYNNGVGITHNDKNISIVLNSPANSSTVFSHSTSFNISSFSNVNLKNITLYLNGNVNETKTITGITNETIFIKNIPTGTVNWKVKVCNINNVCAYSENRTVWAIPFTENYQLYTTPVTENTPQSFYIYVTYPDDIYSSIFAYFYYNGTKYTGTAEHGWSPLVFTAEVTSPFVTSETNFTFYWTIGLVNGGTSYYNSTFYNQTVSNYVIDDCSIYTNLLFNFTLNAEEDKTLINGTLENSTIKTDLTIKSPSGSILSTASVEYNSVNSASICSNINLTSSSYRWDSVTKYYTDLRAEEYYYLQNYSLNNNTDNKTIPLYSLLLTDSTTFTLTYTEDNQIMKGGIITPLRYYIENGTYLEIENGKTDDNGETILHLIEEDIIYKFRVEKEGKFLYLSEDYRVKCSLLTGDCRIELVKESSVTPFPEDWTNFVGGSYILRSYPNERMVSLIFSLDYPATMNLTVYKYSWNETIMSQIIEQKTTTGQYGYLNISIPYSYGNATYYAVLYRDNQFVTSVWLNIKEDIRQYVGVWVNVLIGLMVLTMALIAVSSGVGIIIFTLLGLITAMALQILDMRYAIFSFILIAGILLLIKVMMRRGD